MIRYSLEYALFGLNAAARQQVIADTSQALQARTSLGSVNALEADKVFMGETFAFCEVNEFVSKADGDQIFNVLRTRAAQTSATASPKFGQSYIRLTETDDYAMTARTRRTTSPGWVDDAGSTRPI